MQRFAFTPEQVENLSSWKSNLQREEVRKWVEEQEQAEAKTSRILNDAKFKNGEDLSPEQLDQLFSYMRSFSNNRNLSNLLYNTNNINEFNQRLRKLLHGNEPFSERVNDFFKLKSIGVQTLSQFLISSNSKAYPLITSQTKEVLNISSEQDQAALEDALEQYQVKDSRGLLDRTLNYLRDSVVFRAVKDLLGLEKFTFVNNLLWFEFNKGEEEGLLGTYTSLSVEKDLRDFLSKDVGMIEKGLTLVGKEYDTSEVGRIDLLCKDRRGMHVVIELKKDRKSDEVVGQTLRYLGWVEEHMKTKVRGIIIVSEPDPKLEYALKPLKTLIDLKFYRVNFEILDKFEK